MSKIIICKLIKTLKNTIKSQLLRQMKKKNLDRNLKLYIF
jgi:hypothetical protein